MIDSSGNWYPYGGEMWQNVYDKTETDTLNSAQLAAVNSGISATILANLITLDDVFGLGVNITANSDLDDYRNVGVYYITTAAIAATVSNVPVAAAGRLEIKALNAVNRYIQIYYSVDAFYQRRWNGTAWSYWYKFEGVQI